MFPEPVRPQSKVLVAARELRGRVIEGVSFEVHAGEVLGFAGLIGSGREELPYLLTGARAFSDGALTIRGEPYSSLTPSKAIRAGVGFIPVDRKQQSAMPLLTVRENVTLPRLRGSGVLRWLGTAAERLEASDWLARVEVRPMEPEMPFASLSGGNQQKVVIARWLRCGTEILVLDEPTQGIDVGARAGIYRHLTDLASAGGAVLVFSSDTEELASLCDRVLLLRDGRIEQVVSGAALSAPLLEEWLLRSQAPVSTEVEQ
jgi:ribose transport system ATP-binding protein